MKKLIGKGGCAVRNGERQRQRTETNACAF